MKLYTLALISMMAISVMASGHKAAPVAASKAAPLTAEDEYGLVKAAVDDVRLGFNALLKGRRTLEARAKLEAMLEHIKDLRNKCEASLKKRLDDSILQSYQNQLDNLAALKSNLLDFAPSLPQPPTLKGRMEDALSEALIEEDEDAARVILDRLYQLLAEYHALLKKDPKAAKELAWFPGQVKEAEAKIWKKSGGRREHKKSRPPRYEFGDELAVEPAARGGDLAALGLAPLSASAPAPAPSPAPAPAPKLEREPTPEFDEDYLLALALQQEEEDRLKQAPKAGASPPAAKIVERVKEKEEEAALPKPTHEAVLHMAPNDYYNVTRQYDGAEVMTHYSPLYTHAQMFRAVAASFTDEVATKRRGRLTFFGNGRGHESEFKVYVVLADGTVVELIMDSNVPVTTAGNLVKHVIVAFRVLDPDDIIPLTFA